MPFFWQAQAIMSLASSDSSINTGTSPTTSSKTEQMSESLPSKSQPKAVNENQTQRPPIGKTLIAHILY